MIEQHIKEATCQIHCGEKSGTGWLVSNGRILTARHCILPSIEEQLPISVSFPTKGFHSVKAKLVSDSEKLDACVLSVEPLPEIRPLQFASTLPREGESWETFGYPAGKKQLGHRLCGTIAQVLEEPKLKIDIDLSIDQTTTLEDYRGFSGAPMVSGNAAIALIRLKVDRSIAAISVKQLKSLLEKCDINQPPEQNEGKRKNLADRSNFDLNFRNKLQTCNGSFVFMEGAHGYGKSTYCTNFQSDEKEITYVGTYCISERTKGLSPEYWAQPQVFFDWISTTISTLIHQRPGRKKETSYSETIEQTTQYLKILNDYLAQYSKIGVIFIDGLNEIPDNQQLRHFIGTLPLTLPPQISIVLTAPNYSNLSKHLSGRIRKENVVKLTPLTNSSCYQFCKDALTPPNNTEELIELICEKANGHPLYLRYLIEFANTNPSHDELIEFPVLSGPIEEYYSQIWSKLEEDSTTIETLALVARLRWGIPIENLSETLSSVSPAQFVTSTRKIRHLFSDDGSTTIYHHSFVSFIIERTKAIEEWANGTLAKFCIENRKFNYCTLNKIHHLLKANDKSVFKECTQDWVDKAVSLEVEPDTLISDIKCVSNLSASEAQPSDSIRLALLEHRINFRYDTLFAQSAYSIAEALICLNRPQDALQHVLRYGSLIVPPGDAIHIGYLLIENEFTHEALELLFEIERHIVDAYKVEMELGTFIRLCRYHIKTALLTEEATGGYSTKKIQKILEMARNACKAALKDNASDFANCMSSVTGEVAAFFLSYKGRYTTMEKIEATIGKIPPNHMQTLIFALFTCDSSIGNFSFSKRVPDLQKLFSDFASLVTKSAVDPEHLYALTDTLIRFNAPSQLIGDAGQKRQSSATKQVDFVAKNGVDVDQNRLHAQVCELRTNSYLDTSPIQITGQQSKATDWLAKIQNIFSALCWIDGKARRALADEDSASLAEYKEQLITEVITQLEFPLLLRYSWKDCYAIPEESIPEIYHQLSELIADCFPEYIQNWLNRIESKADQQLGLYSEGFRKTLFYIIEQLTRERLSEDERKTVLKLLNILRNHILKGVENRHELVPDILRLIPIHTKLDAHEIGEELYQHLLSVSMGPTWYKEDQLGIMNAALSSLNVSPESSVRLPQIAGCLEKASGEITFQRYIRAEKATLLGQIVRHDKIGEAVSYFRRQCCGSLEELWGEANKGNIDFVAPLKGARYPGAALDDQEAILTLVKNLKSEHWAFRWALLEIFHCGDNRHISGFAKCYAQIVNGLERISPIVARVEIAALSETAEEDYHDFVSAFRSELNKELHSEFSYLPSSSPPEEPQPINASPSKIESRKQNDDDFYFPGIFGRQSSLEKADSILEEAEHQLTLGNRQKAKKKAIEALRTAQEGDWSIWERVSANMRRAEEILIEGESNASDVFKYYATLLEEERNVPKWIQAEHLINKAGHLLTDEESQELLDSVIEHTQLMIGKATSEIESFLFLSNDSHTLTSEEELFRFVVWLCEHPQWIRRDKAATLLPWLLEQVPKLYPLAVGVAFSMEEGYGPDILCGILDHFSQNEPLGTWGKIEESIDQAIVTSNLTHVSRYCALLRILQRASDAGSESAKNFTSKLTSVKVNHASSTGGVKLPQWASCIRPEWNRLEELVDETLITNWEKELKERVSPLSIDEARLLENTVSRSFREQEGHWLNRWESKVRDSLNSALFEQLSLENKRKVESILRIHNPSQPAHYMKGQCSDRTKQLLFAIENGDYSKALTSSENTLIHHYESIVKPTADGQTLLEVICHLCPISNPAGYHVSVPEQTFRSSELPSSKNVFSPFETCSRVEPQTTYGGIFTPAQPLQMFVKLVDTDEKNFQRESWRHSRRSQTRGFGIFEREGCSLSIARNQMKIPTGFKLAWLVLLDDKPIVFIDEQNNNMI